MQVHQSWRDGHHASGRGQHDQGSAHRVELAVSKAKHLPPQVEPGVQEEVAGHELQHQPPQRAGQEGEEEHLPTEAGRLRAYAAGDIHHSNSYHSNSHATHI